MQDTHVLGWHFLPNDLSLGHGDGRKVEVGETLTVDCEPVLCESGLHASERPLDALGYAPGPVICRVEVGGKVVRGSDKLVGTSRKVLWAYNASDVLLAFARKCALDVAHLWDMPTVVRDYLETGDESKRDAAMAAARAAAMATAMATAKDAAMAAARTAAMATAWNAAWNAALAIAWDTAKDTAWDAQNARLERMLSAGTP